MPITLPWRTRQYHDDLKWCAGDWDTRITPPADAEAYLRYCRTELTIVLNLRIAVGDTPYTLGGGANDIWWFELPADAFSTESQSSEQRCLGTGWVRANGLYYTGAEGVIYPAGTTLNGKPEIHPMLKLVWAAGDDPGDVTKSWPNTWGLKNDAVRVTAIAEAFGN